MHGGRDARAQQGLAAQLGEAARPHGQHAAERDDAQHGEGADDHDAPFHGGLVRGHQAHEKGDEGGLGDDEADAGKVEEDVLEDDGQFDVGRRHGVGQLAAEAVIAVEGDDGIVGEEEGL